MTIYLVIGALVTFGAAQPMYAKDKAVKKDRKVYGIPTEIVPQPGGITA